MREFGKTNTEHKGAFDKIENPRAIFTKTFKYLWPRGLNLRIRVVVSVVLVFLAKILVVGVPLLLIETVNSLNSLNEFQIQESLVIWSIFGLILAYGSVRFSSIAFTQIRDILLSMSLSGD